MTLTKEGFKRIRYDDYLIAMEQDARELFGATVNLDDDSPLGQFIKLIAYQRAEENEAQEDLYNSAFIDTATGISLDHVVKRIGIGRIGSVFATVPLELEVDENFTPPVGVLVANEDGIEFVTTTSAPEIGGIAKVEGIALVAGIEGNVPAGTITVINTPMTGLNGVNNPQQATGGRAMETDTELRERYYRSLAKGGGASIPSIRAALLEVDTIVDAIVEENDTMQTKDGVPPKAIAPFVYGGDDNVIAQIIFEQKAGGIQSFGSTIVDVTDTMGKVHKIGFSRPNIVTIDVRLTLTKTANYPADGDKRVTTQTVAYIGGEDADGAKYDGQGLGGDVIRFKIIAAFAAIPGIDDVVVELSTDGGLTFTEENVVIEGKSIAQTEYTRVVIQ